MDKSDAVVQAIEKLKRSEYKATAIKVELEAQLDRRAYRVDDGCESCDEGRRTCDECGGAWEGARCDNLCNEGYLPCPRECNRGYVGEGDTALLCPEPDCEEGQMMCDECYEDGYYQNCDYCYEGYNDCGDCDGDGGGTWGDTTRCHNWIMSRLAEQGLAEQGGSICLSHGVRSTWNPTGPLKYAEFYNDGSVDSEFTFTLSLEQPENILLLPKFIEVFKGLAAEMGATIQTQGAGMHMAFLNEPNCVYPNGYRPAGDYERFTNFRRGMTLLLPALYFLGSSDDCSRGLGFRRPEVSVDSHRAAIDWRGGAVEFRVFNTCYNTPDAILDNVMVMCNAMKYWRLKYRKHSLSKICSNVRFGNDVSDKLERFYVEANHIDLLNKGLEVLKPSYYTIRQLKEQRNFKVTKATVKHLPKKIRQQAITSYHEYETRFDLMLEVRRHRQTASRMERLIEGLPPEERASLTQASLLERVTQEVEADVRSRMNEKQPQERYVRERVDSLMQQLVGQYNLSEE